MIRSNQALRHAPPERADRPANRNRAAVGIAAGTAALLTAMALINTGRARRAERGAPPVGRFVEVDGVRLHYVDRGSGRPIVLLHGNWSLLQDFETSGLLPAAARKYRVIAFDRPGFGYSERPRSRIWTPVAQAALIHAALRKLGVERPIVVGHSWAALATVAMALEHPDDVSALVLLGGYYFPTARADVPLLSWPAVPLLGDVMRHTVAPILFRAAAPAMFKRMFSPLPIADAVADWPIELMSRPSQIYAAAADTALMVPGAAILSRRYKDLRTPTIIVGGEGDKVSTFEDQSVALHAMVPQSELVTVPGAGHMVHYAAPDTVLAAVDRAAALSERGAEAPDL